MRLDTIRPMISAQFGCLGFCDGRRQAKMSAPVRFSRINSDGPVHRCISLEYGGERPFRVGFAQFRGDSRFQRSKKRSNFGLSYGAMAVAAYRM